MSILQNGTVMGWFLRELRNHKLVVAGSLGISTLCCVVSEVALPYLLAQFLKEWTQPHWEPRVPWLLVWSAVLVVLCAPPRAYLLRRLEYVVRAELSERLDGAIRQRSNQLRLPRAELDSAMKTFFETWSNLSITLSVHLPPLAVGLIGMFVLMGFKAPFMVAVTSVVIVLAIVAARIVGGSLMRAWSERTDKSHQEFEAFDGLIASHEINWLLQIMSKARAQATKAWIEPAQRHARAILYWHGSIQVLSNLLLVAAVVGSVLLVSGRHASVDSMFLLVWFSIMMAQRMTNLFFVAEVFGSGMVDAQVLVDELNRSEHRETPESRKVWEVQLTDVLTRYVRVLPDGTERVTVVTVPDVTFGPGASVLTGGNGKGKSTMLRIIAGLQPYSGSVLFSTPEGSLPIYEYDTRALSVYSSQSNAPLESSTVGSLFGDAPPADVAQAYVWGAVPAEVLPDQRLVDCSGGQRRLVFNAAAMCAAVSSHILLLDEPTNDLDQDNIDLMIAGLRAFIDANPDVIVIVVSHERKIVEGGFRVIEM